MAAEVQKQSRNGKKPVVVLDGVTVSISGQTVKVKGPKGEIERGINTVVPKGPEPWVGISKDRASKTA